MTVTIKNDAPAYVGPADIYVGVRNPLSYELYDMQIADPENNPDILIAWTSGLPSWIQIDPLKLSRLMLNPDYSMPNGFSFFFSFLVSDQVHIPEIYYGMTVHVVNLDPYFVDVINDVKMF